MQLFVFGSVSLAFQKILLGFGSFVFHYWWDGLFVPAATWGFAKIFVGFALTAVGSVVLADNGMRYQIISNLNCTNALYNMVLPSLFGEMDLHRTKLKQISRSAVIKKRALKLYKQRLFSTQ